MLFVTGKSLMLFVFWLLAASASTHDLNLAIFGRQVGVIGTGSSTSATSSPAPSSTPSPSSTDLPSSSIASSSATSQVLSSTATASSAPPSSSVVSSSSSQDSGSSSITSSASSSSSSSISSFSGFTSTNANGQLIIGTTNSNGKPITLTGIGASAATAGITTPITVTTPLKSVQTSKFTTKIVTVSNGQSITQAVTSAALITHTTGTAVVTSSPQLDGEAGGSSSGLSSSSKKIIGGVVGGVGGAIVIGALALVAWRLWGRKRNQTDDDLMADHYSKATLAQENRSSAGGSISNGLERYQNLGQPAPNVNTSSNF